MKRLGEFQGPWTKYLYNIPEFYADLLRSLPRQPDGEDFKLKCSVVVVLSDMGVYSVEDCLTSSSKVRIGSHRVSAHFNSIPTVRPSCHRDWALPAFEEPSSHQSQIPCPPSGILSDTDEFHSSETLLALTCPCPHSSTRSDPFFKITQRLLGFDFTLTCFGKDSTFTKRKLPMLRKFCFIVLSCKMP